LAEGREGRAEGLFFRILRGAYASIAIIVSPSGAFGRGRRAKGRGQRAKGEDILFSAFYEGLTPPSLL